MSNKIPGTCAGAAGWVSGGDVKPPAGLEPAGGFVNLSGCKNYVVSA
jgi:hypothetical protein